jgi:hypothetical protein
VSSEHGPFGPETQTEPAALRAQERRRTTGAYCSACERFRPITYAAPDLVCASCLKVIATFGPVAETGPHERIGPILAALDAIEGRMDAEGHLLDGCPTEPCFGYCDEARAAANGLGALLQLSPIPDRPSGG